ncbi:cyclase family protein [Phenylobacterium sp. SCN 70-31]|uniref:cyclase family protein n=1 Tax=Phenylobacterium sp. SCN 70-31 TaxID=1660129 RepID=UPI0025E22E8C|nr:cyclase family protein [Phenylobacterium sp. SCN 70-31]
MGRTGWIAAGTVLAAALTGGGAMAHETWYPSKYGPADTLGAVNNLSPEGVKRAAALVTTGKVYALGVPTGVSTPAYGERTYSVERIPGPTAPLAPPVGANKVTAYDERVVTSMGIGSQMDGLGHLGIDHRYYNGVHASQVNTDKGFALDLARVPPIVTRGVLIDMVKHFGKPLVAGQAFNRAEIEAAMRAQKVTVGKGDVVLFHTGWMAAKAESDRDVFRSTEPGLGEEGAIWLADQGVVAIGADTVALEAIPFENPDRPFIVHQTLLAKKGVHVLETIDTNALAADGVTEFLFVLGQPRFEGTVQIVINPVAIR